MGAKYLPVGNWPDMADIKGDSICKVEAIEYRGGDIYIWISYVGPKNPEEDANGRF
jgi:hypothetical protein